HGAQMAALGTGSVDELLARAKAAPSMNGLDLTPQVTTDRVYEWTQGSGEWAREKAATRVHVVAIDFGIKHNIRRRLVDAGCRVTGVPATTKADDVLALKPH